MSADGDRQSVMRTTKVRTALKGDSSWIQRQSQSAPEVDDEGKPWITEVRATRVNNEFSEPIDDQTSSGRDPQSSLSTDSSTTSGYLIRGVFTKTDTKTAAPSTNGYIGTSGLTKKASEEYKKIAPHTVRTSVEKTVELTEPSVSAAEQERRTEAASKILDSSARKQRSYVLSAAKKYDVPSGNEDISASPATAFVAKRVVISDDEDTPKQREEMSVDEPIRLECSAPNSESNPTAKPEPRPKPSNKTDDTVTSSVSRTVKVSTPKSSTTTSMNETIIETTSVAPVATLRTSETTKPKSDPTPTPRTTEPVMPAVPAVTEVSSITPKPERKPEATPKPSPAPTPVEKTSALIDKDLLDLRGISPKNSNPLPTRTDLLTGDALPKTKKTKGSLDMLAVDVIPIDTNTDKLSIRNTSTKIETTQTVVQTKTNVKSASTKPVETTSTLIDKDLLDLSISKKPMEPVPPNTTDLLTGGSLPKTQKTTKSLDLLAYDVIPIDTNKDALSSGNTQSKVTTQTTVIQTKTVEKSSADLFDPIQIVRESTKSNDVQNQGVTVTFEQKSSKSDSPWDKWTVPKIDTIVEEISSTRIVKEEKELEKELEPDAKKNLVYIKQYLNSEPSGYNTSRYSGDYDYVTSSSSSYSYSSLPSTANMTACTYCGELVGNDSKITIEHLKISCHPDCFKCGICSKPMGDFLHSMFLHRGTVHCESCYANVI